ncbi:transglutaminase-like domain-containing protein [Endozoicomonas ascidiicola]|uniref:transglutaminase-like domain-containing protein n=1 Tax=Endozoicomonas ascidiicola TaxID=1698521 RepID=UPI00082995DE|nr:transglutaminase domain-containing protein [Endozoicomonas ascidiicola]
MNRNAKWITAFIVFAVVAAAGYFLLEPSSIEGETVYSQPKSLRYTFEIRNDSEQPYQGGSVWVYAPAEQTSFQKVKEIRVSGADYQLEKDALGNQTLELKVGPMAPGGRKTVTVSTLLHMASALQPVELQDYTRYLKAEPFIEIDKPELATFSLTFAGMPLDEKAAAIKTTVGNHITYAGYVRENLGALYALREKRGDCTEYMSLSVAALRLNDIPARAVAGFVVPGQSAVLSSDDYHNWTEFYNGTGWQVLDAQNQKLAEQQDHYVVFRILSGQTEENNARFSERFVSSDSQLKIRLI